MSIYLLMLNIQKLKTLNGCSLFLKFDLRTNPVTYRNINAAHVQNIMIKFARLMLFIAQKNLYDKR